MGLLEGKCALITGGTTGLGLAIAERFRREGARVVITGRDHDLGGRAEQTLGPGVRFVAATPPIPALSRRRCVPPQIIWAGWTCW